MVLEVPGEEHADIDGEKYKYVPEQQIDDIKKELGYL